MSKPLSQEPTIGLTQAVALYISAVLGAGILLVPGLAAEIAGPASIIAWGLMALLTLPMGLVMGLLSAKFPSAGGVSHFVMMAFGEKAGILVGWFFLMSVPIGAPVTAVTGAEYLTSALHLGAPFELIFAGGILLVALLINAFGMKLVGNVQVAVVIAILAVLVTVVIVAMPFLHQVNFTPFMPHGWASIGRATSILFWCFIGWEAVSHLSEDFVNPERVAVKGVVIASAIVGILYLLTALSTIGTHSYGQIGSNASLVLVIEKSLGKAGALIVGFTAVFICTATTISYVGAAVRLAYKLSETGNAPQFFSTLSRKRNIPIGVIGSLSISFVSVLVVYGTGTVPMALLLQFPNATFVLTYIGGCAAGIRLLRNSMWSVLMSWLSLFVMLTIIPFLGWGAVYPLLIVIGLLLVHFVRKKRTAEAEYYEVNQ